MIIQPYLPNKNPGPDIKAVKIAGPLYSIYLYGNQVIAVLGANDGQVKSAVYNPGPGDHAKTAAYNAVMKETNDTIRYHTKSKASFLVQANSILKAASVPFGITNLLVLVENEPKTTPGTGGNLFIPKSDWNTALSKAINNAEIVLDEERVDKLIKVMRDLVVQWNPALEPIDGNPTDMKFKAETVVMEKPAEPKGTYTDYKIYGPKKEFKVGDKVKITCHECNEDGVLSGEVTDLTMSEWGAAGVEIKTNTGSTINHTAKVLELIDKPKFKVGDKVKIISHEATNEILSKHACMSSPNYAIGTIHTVENIEMENEGTVSLELYWMAVADLELVEQRDTPGVGGGV